MPTPPARHGPATASPRGLLLLRRRACAPTINDNPPRPRRTALAGIQPILFAVCILDGLPWLLQFLGTGGFLSSLFSLVFSPGAKPNSHVAAHPHTLPPLRDPTGLPARPATHVPSSPTPHIRAESPLYYVAYWLIVFGFTFLDVEDVPQEISEYMVKARAFCALARELFMRTGARRA